MLFERPLLYKNENKMAIEPEYKSREGGAVSRKLDIFTTWRHSAGILMAPWLLQQGKSSFIRHFLVVSNSTRIYDQWKKPRGILKPINQKWLNFLNGFWLLEDNVFTECKSVTQVQKRKLRARNYWNIYNQSHWWSFTCAMEWRNIYQIKGKWRTLG